MALLMAILPTLLQFIGMALKSAGAKQESLEAFQKLVEATHNDGLITVATKNAFVDQKNQMEQAFALDTKAQSPTASPKT